VPSPFHARGRSAALAFAWTTIVVCAAVAWYAGGGVLGVLAVFVVGAMIVTYRRANPFRNWQTGRPWRDSSRRPARDAHPGQAGSDPVEDWLRERSLYDPFDDRNG
jgi:hypothetical protein